jgi:hypothetical protein
LPKFLNFFRNSWETKPFRSLYLNTSVRESLRDKAVKNYKKRLCHSKKWIWALEFVLTVRLCGRRIPNHEKENSKSLGATIKRYQFLCWRRTTQVVALSNFSVMKLPQKIL